MGWGVNDYPSAPPEPTSWWCSRGCEMDRAAMEASRECAAKGCQEYYLCADCVYECRQCSEAFCFDHVRDIAAPEESEAHYVCLTCFAEARELRGAPRKDAAAIRRKESAA